MNTNEDQAIEGEIIDNTTKQKAKNVKAFKVTDLPLKQRKFIKAYRQTGNGTKSAIEAGYAEGSAHVTASRLLKTDKVLAILNDSVEEAESVIRGLMTTSDNPQIQLAAAKEVLDRTIGKPIQRSESVQVNITVEQMLNND